MGDCMFYFDKMAASHSHKEIHHAKPPELPKVQPGAGTGPSGKLTTSEGRAIEVKKGPVAKDADPAKATAVAIQSVPPRANTVGVKLLEVAIGIYENSKKECRSIAENLDKKMAEVAKTNDVPTKINKEVETLERSLKTLKNVLTKLATEITNLPDGSARYGSFLREINQLNGRINEQLSICSKIRQIHDTNEILTLADKYIQSAGPTIARFGQKVEDRPQIEALQNKLKVTQDTLTKLQKSENHQKLPDDYRTKFDAKIASLQRQLDSALLTCTICLTVVDKPADIAKGDKSVVILKNPDPNKDKLVADVSSSPALTSEQKTKLKLALEPTFSEATNAALATTTENSQPAQKLNTLNSVEKDLRAAHKSCCDALIEILKLKNPELENNIGKFVYEKLTHLEVALRGIGLAKAAIFEQELGKESPATQQLFSLIQEIVGKDCPIPIDQKFGLLALCRVDPKKFDGQKALLDICGLAKQAKEASLKNLIKGKPADISGKINTAFNTTIALPFDVEPAHGSLTRDEMKDVNAFGMLLIAKIGDATNTQFITDGMSNALPTPAQLAGVKGKGTSEREMFALDLSRALKAYETDGNVEGRPVGLTLAREAFRSWDGYSLDAKTQWDVSQNNKFKCVSSFALKRSDGTTVMKEKTMNLDLSSLGHLTDEQRVATLAFARAWLNGRVVEERTPLRAAWKNGDYERLAPFIDIFPPPCPKEAMKAAIQKQKAISNEAQQSDPVKSALKSKKEGKALTERQAKALDAYEKRVAATKTANALTTAEIAALAAYRRTGEAFLKKLIDAVDNFTRQVDLALASVFVEVPSAKPAAAPNALPKLGLSPRASGRPRSAEGS